jgi:hypothetical protein
MILEQFQNYELRLGKNQKENDELITDASEKNTVGCVASAFLNTKYKF